MTRDRRYRARRAFCFLSQIGDFAGNFKPLTSIAHNNTARTHRGAQTRSALAPHDFAIGK
ncbi:hypothetical protein SAMN05444421_101240 [Celeribacter marinus]|nr:hypothetical protein SAMN05444421_101240 [Celeribacter marinus]